MPLVPSPPFQIKQGDTLPNIYFKFYEADGTTPLDLTAATNVRIVIRNKASKALLFKKVCTIDDALNGEGYYDWTTGDTSAFGNYEFEFEITWNSGDIQTIPVSGYFDLVIVDDVG